jgi:diaminopimelate decarboxylase
MEYEEWLKRKDLEYRDGTLYFANMNAWDLAEKYGTPIYVINEQMIRKRYQTLKKILNSEYEKNGIYFAMKANSSLSVLRILNSEGACFDCTSAGEIYTCFKAGITPDKIIYTGNMFTNEDFKFAVENNVLINLDSLGQLDRLTRVHELLKKEKKMISFRINPEFGAGHHAHVITAGKEIKFGILEDQVVEAYAKAKKLGFKKFGIHQHIGSGIMDPQDYEKAVEKFLAIIKNLANSLKIQFEFVDFGGGLGVPYRPEEEPLDLNAYKDIVIKKFRETVKKEKIGDPMLLIEPGRFLSAEASILLVQINTIKDNGYKLFAGINAGFNTLIRPAMYGSYHHIIVCKKDGKAKQLKYDIVGPICESGDVMGKEREMPELKEGDYLTILDAGAYGFTMSSPYNSRPRPAEVLVNNGKSFLVRRVETYDDLLKHQIIPDHLK